MSQIEQSIEVNVPVSTAYNQWTQFEQFPQFMETIEEVRQLDDTHLHWVAAVGGKRHEWDAVITEQKPDERVAWKSVDGTRNAGVVTFHRLSDNSCKIMAQIGFEPEGVIEKIGSVLGSDDRRVKTDLENFKAMIEQRGRETGGWRGEVGKPADEALPHDEETAGHGDQTSGHLDQVRETVGDLSDQKVGAKIGNEPR